jgi:superfamily II DNA/RNA helicase
MRQLKFTEATPVQAAVWAAACQGQDVQAVAEPGTGKTLAYLLPALVRVHQLLQQEQQQLGHGAAPGSHISGGSSRAGVVEPLVLVVAPSRELAQQVWGVCKRLYAATRLSSAVVYGGVDKQEQLQMLQRRRPLLLVATPGRLLDLLDSSSSSSEAGVEVAPHQPQQQQRQRQGGLSLGRVQLLVLDEADKMLSVGFRPQLERIAAQLALLGPPAAGAAAADAAGGDAAQEPEKKKKRKKTAKGLAVQQQGARPRPQVLLLTATLDPELRQVADGWLQDPLRVRVNQGADAISKTITQVGAQQMSCCCCCCSSISSAAFAVGVHPVLRHHAASAAASAGPGQHWASASGDRVA